jgi:hypothetical protein
MLNGCRNLEEIEARRNSMMADYGTQVEWWIVNLNDYGDIKSMVVDRKTFLGSLSILLSTMRDNLWVCFYPIRRAIPKMFEQNWGRIVNIAWLGKSLWVGIFDSSIF